MLNMSGLVPFNRKKRSPVSRNFNDFGDFYNMVDDFFNGSSKTNFGSFKVDVQEDENKYLIEADLPGVEKNEVDIEINEGNLSISVKREENINEEKSNYIHKERHYTSMSRNIYLEDAKSEGIKANLENGVLKITIPKEQKPSNTKKIDID